MATLVLSCGRTGTNLTVSILQGNPYFNIDSRIENRTIFNPVSQYPSTYLCKSDVTYLPHIDKLLRLLEINKEMKVVWTIRDPRDVLLSKIKRGQLIKDGGDNTGSPSEDSTVEGAIESLTSMYNAYRQCIEKYSERCILVKMEDILLDIEGESKKMCNFLNIEYHPNMLNFTNRIIDIKKKRYGNKIDKSQVALWKNWETIYDKFFTIKGLDMEIHFTKIKDMISYFNYGTTVVA